MDTAAHPTRLQQPEQAPGAFARQRRTAPYRHRGFGAKHVGIPHLDRGLAAVRQLDHQPHSSITPINTPRAQRATAQRMIASDDPHHRGQPQPQMVQCEPNSKGDWPHLTSITDPAALDTELARIRGEYNTVRLHAAIGYVTPDDEHHGRGPQIRRARAAGLKRARAERIKQNRASKR